MRFTSVITLLCIIAIVCIYPSCQKQFTLDIAPSTAATGTLLDSAGNCLVNSVAGTFYTGIKPGRDTAYVQVKVNVKTVGSYSITSNKQNGLYFADSGYFYTTGIHTIRLKPVGTPISIGGNYYAFNFDSTSCSFHLLIKDSTGTGLVGNGGGQQGGSGSTGKWRFSAKALDTTRSTNATGSLVSAGGINALSITGTTAGADTSLNIVIQLTSATVPTSGTYNASNGNVVLQVNDASGNAIYSALAISGVTLTVNITSYNTTTKELVGSFSGNVKGKGGFTATLSAGSFDVLVQ